jgi:type IV secretory pathway component VirB8
VNDASDDMLLPPPGDQFSGLRDAIFHDVIAAHEAEQYYNRERSRAGWWVGGIGAALGVLGVCAATVMAVCARPAVRYTEIDDSSGVVRESFGAKDAPDHFNDRVTNHYLREYIGLRESFVWQMDPETDHRVKLMSSPGEQRRYQADRDANPPADRYGMSGYARVTHWTAFTLRAKGKDRALEYDVQFVKGELLAGNTGQVRTTHMTARIVFAFHPELPMNDQDRLDDESGLMVLSYNASAD